MDLNKPRRRVIVALVAVLALLASGAAAGAQEISFPGHPEWTFRVNGGPVPQEILDHFADCPRPEDFPSGQRADFCLKIKVYDGEIKLGDIEATVDGPIELTVGVRGSGDEIVIAEPEADPSSDAGGLPGLDEVLHPLVDLVLGDGATEPGDIKLPGGLLGIPALDPVIDLEPVGLLALSATPEIGEPEPNVAFGTGSDSSILSVPLSIRVHNPLLGPDCRIGTPADPIEINLTTGTTSPPEGVEPPAGWEPTTGEPGPTFGEQFLNYESLGSGFGGVKQVDWKSSQFVDNAFTVPPAQGCGPLGTDLLNDLINSEGGLPSPMGNNYARFTIDRSWAFGVIVALANGEDVPLLAEADPPVVNFGGVEVGTASAVETVVITNPQSEPLSVGAAGFPPGFGEGPFEIADDRCGVQILGPGESCEVDVQFKPTAPGGAQRIYSDALLGGIIPIGVVHFGVFGLGVAPLATAETSLDFGSLDVGQTSPDGVATFENTSESTQTVAQGAALSGPSARLSSWEVVSDGCLGATLQPGEGCSVEVRFAPDSAGTKDVTLDLRGAGPLVLGRVGLKGSGVSPLAPDASSLAFGDGFVGEESGVQVVTFEHVGGAAATATDGVTLSGTSSRFSSWQLPTDTCTGATLSPGDTCEVGVRFAPDSAGNKSVTLQVRGDGGAVLGGVSLSAAGVVPLVPNQSPLAFGTVTVGDASPIQAAVFENVGAQPANAEDGAALSGTASRFASWDIVSDGCIGEIIDPGETCEVDIRLAPNSSGNKAVTLQVRGVDGLVLGAVSLTGSGANP